MSDPSGPTARLRARINNGPLLLVPGAANALGARVIEDLGFEAVYLSGAGIANTFYGLPDIGLVTLNDLCAHVSAIRDAIELPLIVDADTGFGNAIGTGHAFRLIERAGADAIQIEDQVSPKKCGHFEGKQIISSAEMVQKVRAAADSRVNEDVIIIARTDARVIEGIDAAVDRASAYIDAGADVAFIEAPQNADEVRELPKRLAVPQLINLVEGGKTPLLPLDELQDFSIALFANLSLQASIRGMQNVLTMLRDNRALTPEMQGQIANWDVRQATVRKPLFDELEERYSS